MRGLIAVVAVLICCMADPLAPWSRLQTVNPPQQGMMQIVHNTGAE